MAVELVIHGQRCFVQDGVWECDSDKLLKVLELTEEDNDDLNIGHGGNIDKDMKSALYAVEQLDGEIVGRDPFIQPKFDPDVDY